MDQALIERLAREAGFDDEMEGRGIWIGEGPVLRRLVVLVAARCAEEAEPYWTGTEAAKAIRAKFKEQ
jgi:hypothetical protein